MRVHKKGRSSASSYLNLSNAPPYWRDLSAPSGFLSPVQRRDWLLVLSARNIPWHISKVNSREHIYVPPVMEALARFELSAFLRENRKEPIKEKRQIRPYAFLSLLIFIPLIFWHGIRRKFWSFPSFLPTPDSLINLGELDKLRINFHGEYYRALTALTLHADASHLLGNLFFGAIFIYMLARLTGPGRAILLTILGGFCGNLLSIFFHSSTYVSIGFSTALFSSLGLIGGIMIIDAYDKRRLLLATGGVIGLLAMLGAEGEHTDYAAHISGLGCGLILGIFEGWRQKKHYPELPQFLAALIALLLLFIAWLAAFDLLKF